MKNFRILGISTDILTGLLSNIKLELYRYTNLLGF
jgi:hypothetical protein